MATILTCYYRPKPGGLCTRLFRAMRALLDRGHTVHYLALTPFPIDHPRLVFHRFPWPARLGEGLLFWGLFHLLSPWMLLGIGLRHRVTHVFAFGPTYAYLMRPLCRMKGIVPTFFLRGDPILSHRLRGKAPWIVRLDRWIEGMAIQNVKVVGVSSHLARKILERHPDRRPRQVRVLPNDLPALVTQSARASEGPLRLAVAGILEPMKNHAFVLGLLRGLERQAWHFYIYGQGPAARRLDELVGQLGLGAKVSFMGWVPSNAIWPRVDLLLAPSLHEGMPNAVLEAVAAGVPVLASDIPAHREILPADQLLPLDDAGRWRQALVGILDDSHQKRSAMARHQRQTSAHLCFDWDARIVALIVPPKISSGSPWDSLNA
jgi:glycosyltransferase involved in cell wall biosynthesis